jgi:RNA polymerase sigma factor (sigma-70 family)
MSDSFLRLMDPDPRKAEQACNRLRERLVFRFQHNLSPEAEDLAQETLLRVLEKVQDMGRTVENGFTANDLIQFTFGVARNVAKEAPRRRKWSAGSEGLPEGLESGQGLSSRDPDPESSFLAKEPWDLVHGCLLTLPASSRELVSSWFLDEKTHHKDIAQRLGISPNGLRIRVFRGLESVRKCVRNRIAKQRI